jgi:hypothetical protein
VNADRSIDERRWAATDRVHPLAGAPAGPLRPPTLGLRAPALGLRTPTRGLRMPTLGLRTP